MNAIEEHGEHYWQLLSWLGIEHPFLAVDRTVVIDTWIILILLFVFLFPVRWLLKRHFSIPRFLILSTVNSFVGLTTQALGKFVYGHFTFVTALFIFICICNIISIVPWMEEPTANINTPIALGLLSFLYIQVQGIRAHGILGYLKEYFVPLFIMAPINVIGKLASIISISCRLFGNIYGGSIISQMYFSAIEHSVITQIFGLVIGLNFIITFFFGLFEGFLQAFVFTMLSLTYLSLTIQSKAENAGANV